MALELRGDCGVLTLELCGGCGAVALELGGGCGAVGGGCTAAEPQAVAARMTEISANQSFACLNVDKAKSLGLEIALGCAHVPINPWRSL